MRVSPHAIIDPKAQIAEDVEIGPFCVIGPHVRIDRGCRLHNSVTIVGHTTIGQGNVFHPQCVFGGPPQDRKYKGQPTRLEIGNNNIFREHVTVHIGTERGGGITRVGNNNMLMVNSHLGHDVQLGSNCILANNCMIAGHVIIGDNVAMMGGVGVHHFARIGKFCFIGGYARIHHDAPPFCKLDGADEMRGLNIKGLRAGGFADDDIAALEEAYGRLFARKSEEPFATVLESFDVENGLNQHVKHMVEFLQQRDLGRHGRYLQGMRAR
ncbi:MAG TPA: acyl-ACP--UDP-N-acetylglucosamine O-acyltransferase [Tepidisphaeraceae bacterium]|nr:acyl-ACP--UDP-N-acetylglucosamine O-acyltransferase [Tepidisphaeraceae bacterium]